MNELPDLETLRKSNVYQALTVEQQFTFENYCRIADSMSKEQIYLCFINVLLQNYGIRNVAKTL